MACAESGGRPIILLVVGPSGAGKTQTVKIASSIIEAKMADVTDAFAKDEEHWRRRVGEAIDAGHRPLLINDLHRQRQLHQQMKSIIGLEDPIHYRPLFASATSTSFRAPLILTCVTVPRAVCAPEVARRIRVVHLFQKCTWFEPDVNTWRNAPTEEEESLHTPPQQWQRAQAGEAILHEALRISRSCGFSWDKVCAHLDVPTGEHADPEQDAIDSALLVKLFIHCCGADRVTSLSKRWPGKAGWIDLTSPNATEILRELLPDLGGNTDPRHVLTQTLMETDWGRVLGTDTPVRFLGKVRHQTWVGKFVGRGIRGQAPVNEHIGVAVSDRHNVTS